MRGSPGKEGGREGGRERGREGEREEREEGRKRGGREGGRERANGYVLINETCCTCFNHFINRLLGYLGTEPKMIIESIW